MNRIFAADLSLTSTGYAIADSGEIVTSGVIHGLSTSRQDDGDGIARLIHNRDAVCAKIDTWCPDLVVFEGFAFGANMNHAREIAGMSYMIRAELHQDGIPYVLVSPLSLKKYCVGTAGSAKNKVGKEHVLLHLYKNWGHSVSSNDEADALVLAHIGLALTGQEEPNAVQREVLAKLKYAPPVSA